MFAGIASLLAALAISHLPYLLQTSTFSVAARRTYSLVVLFGLGFGMAWVMVGELRGFTTFASRKDELGEVLSTPWYELPAELNEDGLILVPIGGNLDASNQGNRVVAEFATTSADGTRTVIGTTDLRDGLVNSAWRSADTRAAAWLAKGAIQMRVTVTPWVAGEAGVVRVGQPTLSNHQSEAGGLTSGGILAPMLVESTPVVELTRIDKGHGSDTIVSLIRLAYRVPNGRYQLRQHTTVVPGWVTYPPLRAESEVAASR